MNVEMNSVDAQYFLVYFFKKMTPEQGLCVLDVLSHQKLDKAIFQYIMMCMQHGSQMRKNPNYCNTLDSTCNTIKKILNSTNDCDEDNTREEKQNQLSYIQLFGWSNRVQWIRIKCNMAIMDLKRIEQLCERFQNDIKKRFWRNWILYYFSNTYYIPCKKRKKSKGIKILNVKSISMTSKRIKNKDVESKVLKDTSIENKSFNIIIKLLHEDNQKLNFLKQVKDDLLKDRQDKMGKLFEVSSYDFETSKLGKPPYRLYNIIYQLLKPTHMTVQNLVEDELQVSMNSWYAWKKNWEEAEESDFQFIPTPKLKKNHILLIAIVFKLNYMETWLLLQIAGYRIGTDDQDKELVDYFLNGTGCVEKLKIELRNK